MMEFFAKLLANIGLLTANGSESACPWFWIDEPETPASLIK